MIHILILNDSEKEIIIIDNYIDKNILDILRKLEREIIIVTNNTDTSIEKYKSQYNNIEFIYDRSFHDRFIILDKKKIYLCGASFKDIGKKCFGITKVEEDFYLEKILNIVNQMKGDN